MSEATIRVDGRVLRLTGTHPAYTSQFSGHDGDEMAVVKIARDLPPQAVVFDVGANIGVTALAIAAARPDCPVTAFEPIPSNADCLRRNIQANQIANVAVVEAAVGDTAGEITLRSNGPGSYAIPGTDGQRVRVITLDSFAAAAADFIKCDTEGYEANVLAGARCVIAASRPWIYLEFNAWTLALQRYCPMTFAEALYNHFDLVGVFAADRQIETPKNPAALVHKNIVQGLIVLDVLVRGRTAPLPDLAAMTVSPAQFARLTTLHAEVKALRESTSWRVTAPLRAARQALS